MQAAVQNCNGVPMQVSQCVHSMWTHLRIPESKIRCVLHFLVRMLNGPGRRRGVHVGHGANLKTSHNGDA